MRVKIPKKWVTLFREIWTVLSTPFSRFGVLLCSLRVKFSRWSFQLGESRRRSQAIQTIVTMLMEHDHGLHKVPNQSFGTELAFIHSGDITLNYDLPRTADVRIHLRLIRSKGEL